MKNCNLKHLFLTAFLFLFSSCVASYPGKTPLMIERGRSPARTGGRFMTGADVLASHDWDLLRGRRVGLITNQTGVMRDGTPTRVAMQRSGVNLVALFAPEHGIFGTEVAGRHISSSRDPMTGLICFSLYDENREPSAAMLASVDVMVFDIQDIGSRSYTYISTMIRSMEACGKHGRDFVVLDRPNPLGGNRIQGPPLERRWKSFVGQIPVPYCHGMTAGELARMSVGEGWLDSPRPRNLWVVPMRGWSRKMVWQDTGMPWNRTSPNIPNAKSPFFYASTGILGGASGCDVGFGVHAPFSRAGALGVDGEEFAWLMRREFPGVGFTPYQFGRFGGVELGINPHSNVDLVALDVALTCELNRITKGAVSRIQGAKLELFNKVYGSASFYEDLLQGRDWRSIVGSWQRHNHAFASRRQRYLLYH